MRSVSLNCHVFVLFKNKRDQLQIKTLARQMYPGKASILIDSYSKATDDELFGYLIIDISPSSQKYQLRTQIFPVEDVVIFKPKKLKSTVLKKHYLIFYNILLMY